VIGPQVEIGNDRFRQLGIDKLCRLVRADCNDMSVLDGASQDAAYAIYSLKYIPRLDFVMAEVARILRPGGLFVVYDLLKTDAYDEKNEKHRCAVIYQCIM
jgi:sterol 24-C-methyltransferase